MGEDPASDAKGSHVMSASEVILAKRGKSGAKTTQNDTDVIRVNSAKSPPIREIRGFELGGSLGMMCSIRCLGKGSGIVFTAATRTTEAETQTVRKCYSSGCSSAGRAPPCQGGCREFESRQPLVGHRSVFHGGVAERRGNGLQIRAHGFESRSHLHFG